jgi:hypothetical protein
MPGPPGDSCSLDMPAQDCSPAVGPQYKFDGSCVRMCPISKEHRR